MSITLEDEKEDLFLEDDLNLPTKEFSFGDDE